MWHILDLTIRKQALKAANKDVLQYIQVLVLGPPALENSALGSKKSPLLSFLCSLFGLLPCEPEQLQIFFERQSPRFLWPTSFRFPFYGVHIMAVFASLSSGSRNMCPASRSCRSVTIACRLCCSALRSTSSFVTRSL